MDYFQFGHRATVLTLSLLLGGCLGSSEPPPSPTVPAGAICQGMRPDFPMTYHVAVGSPGGGHGEDQPDTIARAKRINARFASLCP